MPRLSPLRYEHFEQVDVQHIRPCFSHGRTHRRELDIPYRPDPSRTRTVAVILKNPSAADEHRADRTIQTVEREIHRLFSGAGRLRILNLFALRATDTRDVRDAIKNHDLMWAIGHRNDAALRCAIAESDYVVAAWGERSSLPKRHYDSRVKRVVCMLDRHRAKVKYVGGLSKKAKHPRHGMLWRTTDQLDTFPDTWRWWPPSCT